MFISQDQACRGSCTVTNCYTTVSHRPLLRIIVPTFLAADIPILSFTEEYLFDEEEEEAGEGAEKGKEEEGEKEDEEEEDPT